MYVWLHVLLLPFSSCEEPWGFMQLLHSWSQCSSRRRYYPGELPKLILTRRPTWKVSIHLFIRFGSQLALSFVVSVSLKTCFYFFMFFLWSEKFWQSSFEGKFSEHSSQIYIHISKPVSLGFYFQDEIDNHFYIRQDTTWIEVMGLSQQFLLPLFFFPSISSLQVGIIEIADVYSNLCSTWWKQLGLLFVLCQNHQDSIMDCQHEFQLHG